MHHKTKIGDNQYSLHNKVVMYTEYEIPGEY